MTDKEKIQQMMCAGPAVGIQAASQRLVFNPESRRLEIASVDGTTKKNMLRVVPKDELLQMDRGELPHQQRQENTMTNKERIQQMMRDMAKGKQASNHVIYGLKTERLKVTSTDDAAKKDVLRVTPEDMKLSHSCAASWQEAEQ
ncbi:hypothetical protein PDESU_02040 [Pontiella desulfatans]|jgi:hypothetical protein|uniref:Uncharacterized protein n=1 Tax=Pontiella desulfatans TaxID=2750659 RepID=A0A6C2U0T1_PONDE|nr:hypothetical protein [Pontiella desulfatans]VGO13483.1 hypothetical protein PDESU_02040 [Pontiella desulfatans]